MQGSGKEGDTLVDRSLTGKQGCCRLSGTTVTDWLLDTHALCVPLLSPVIDDCRLLQDLS